MPYYNRKQIDPKMFAIIAVVIGGIAAALAVYWYTSHQQIQAQYDISHIEQCNAKGESLKQMMRGAAESGQSLQEFEDMHRLEVDSLKAECGDVFRP
jgi:hypothetical protein